ncbi:branched-chain amino acid ABC transporter permease [Proteiniclasticum ruminis]|uniref:Branched-chain amino acid transport system permease protein n=1 Tax=Proteiniclasticum ruminis TaxID=398199 RepID=A0A1G8JU17_9CLOT|nr:branched-chain amino acid ABC transporter permease [Proteiniclasticum ruminis]SDI34625.1 branched-chain amino acid transport system permease protein [Proteiniclasticum ruminis]
MQEVSKPTKSTVWNVLRGTILEHKGAVIGVLFIGTVVAYMLQERYLALILCFICINSIAVSGLDILFGYTGQVSFGHAGFYAIGAYGSTLLSMKLGIPVILSVILAALLATFFGMIIAFPASKLVKHFLSLLTIAFGQMVFMFISVTDKITNGFSGIMNVPNITFFGYTFVSNQSYFFLFALVTLLVIISKKRLINSRVGRAFIALRENPHAAAGMGINVRYYKILAFSLSAFLTGLAGAFYAHLVGFISPDTFMSNQSNIFMTMLLFGGIASYLGPVIGSAILVIVTELMQSFVSYQMLIYAFFILAVLFYLPNGVVGIYEKMRMILLRRKERKVN